MADRNYDDECRDHGGDGGDCGLAAGWGTDFDTGKCRFHRGTSPDGSSHEDNNFAEGNEGGAPENNCNAEKHGLTADREKWFERHREGAEPLVRALVESYVEDAPFGFESVAKVDQLCEVAIDQARLRESNEYLDEFLTEQVVGQDEDGAPVTRVEENPAHMPRDRIKRTNARILKELGILDDPDSAQADATKTLAEVIDE